MRVLIACHLDSYKTEVGHNAICAWKYFIGSRCAVLQRGNTVPLSLNVRTATRGVKRVAYA
jgi:hypothetical protein